MKPAMSRARVFVGLILLGLLPACNQSTFEIDPLCDACIDKACHNAEAMGVMQRHLATLDAPTAAQLVSRAEAHDGCAAQLPADAVESAYAHYAVAFFASDQPYARDRALRAVQIAASELDYRPHALHYLTTHKDAVMRDQVVVDAAKTTLVPLAETKDDVFGLLATVLPKNALQPLADMEETPARNALLAPRYADFDDETLRLRLLKQYVIAEWHMQASGSTMLPQFLELDWGMYPMPDGVDQLPASLNVKSVSVKGDEAKRRGEFVRDGFADEPMREANRHMQRIDLGPWLKTADQYRISAKAEVSVWPTDVSDACLAGDEACDKTPLAVVPANLDFTYRAYVGVETGAPKRSKDATENGATSKAMSLKVCNESKCVTLWDGKVTSAKSREKIAVTQGHDFYLLADVSGARLPVAGRLMARAVAGGSWQEVATLFAAAPSIYTPSVRANIDLSQVCSDKGKCTPEFQLRPSLRMARRDPAFTRYWGDTLELGSLNVDIQNRTSFQVYKSF